MKLGIENALAASLSFILCLLTKGPYCRKPSYEPEELFNVIPDEEEYRPKFPVYWNVPTFQCHKYGLNFSSVSQWGILQNPGDDFRGDVISILYDPGEFPALLEAPPRGSVPRNGGVPQEGSFSRHMELFKSHLEKLIPWPNYEGLGVLDFEHWRPVWHQNWGSLNMYRTFSKVIERRRHPFWFPSMIETEAIYRYELSAKMFLLETLRTAKLLRPNAKWGYYGYPFCFNFTPNNNRESCSDEVIIDNDKMDWLFTETSGFYPSLYLKERDMGVVTRRRFVRGRLVEALRVAKDTPVFPYVWYKYHDSHRFLTPEDMLDVMGAPRNRGCSGVVIWGASRDVNTEEKCLALLDYVENVIGPAVAQINAGFNDSLIENPTTESPELTTDVTDGAEPTTVVPELAIKESDEVDEEEEENEEEEEEEEEEDNSGQEPHEKSKEDEKQNYVVHL